MPGMKISVPHKLSQEEAAGRMKNLIKQVQAQFASQIKNMEESWSGPIGNFAFDVMGMNIKGTLTVLPHEVNMEGQIPFAAMPFKGKIETAVRDKITQLLA